jgi:hypothetical protein
MADEPSSPRRWARVSGLLRDLATPLTVAIVGLLASVYVNNKQSVEANQRAFAELVSQRESADTNLRIEMFKTVLEGFLRQGPATGVSDQILKLEILAYNFNESLDLGPLFQDVFRRVKGTSPDDPDRIRLRQVASDVVFKQMEALTFELGVSKDAPVIDFEALQANPSGIPGLIDQDLELRYRGDAALAHPARRFTLSILGRDERQQELTVRLAVSPPGKPDAAPEVDVRFSVGYFDFPAINNTRLSNGERCAVVVRNMDDSSARVSLVYFPANRAGLKDRMYVEEILDQMTQIK